MKSPASCGAFLWVGLVVPMDLILLGCLMNDLAKFSIILQLFQNKLN